MGLDISVYGDVVLNPHWTSPDEAYDAGGHWFYPNLDRSQQADGIVEGGYHVSTPSPSLDFRAGSYSDYNEWRSVLALVGCGARDREVWERPSEFRQKRFVELVNFSDCEGIIGPKTSQKLAVDFVASRPTDDAVRSAMSTPAREAPDHDVEWWFTKYEAWFAAFRYAGNHSGVVEFH